MRRKILAASAALALIVGMSGFGTAVAQDGQGGARRGGGQGQQMDPEQARARMMENLKERLAATDEEWQALQPKVEQVLAAQMNARAGAMMGMGRGAGGGGPGGGLGRGPEGEPTPLVAAGRELRELLQDEEAGNDAIKQKLEAFRAARKQAETELDAARAELQGLVTLRQEALLVAMGLLE